MPRTPPRGAREAGSAGGRWGASTSEASLAALDGLLLPHCQAHGTGQERTPLPPKLQRGPQGSILVDDAGRFAAPHQRRVGGRHTDRQRVRRVAPPRFRDGQSSYTSSQSATSGHDRTPSPPATGSWRPDRCSPAIRRVGSRPSQSGPPISSRAPRRRDGVWSRSSPPGPRGARAGRQGSRASRPPQRGPSGARSGRPVGSGDRERWVRACLRDAERP